MTLDLKTSADAPFGSTSGLEAAHPARRLFAVLAKRWKRLARPPDVPASLRADLGLPPAHHDDRWWDGPILPVHERPKRRWFD